MTIVIRPVEYSEPLFAPLLCDGQAHDGAFLLRLRDRWLSGSERFDRAGEILLGAFEGERLIGVAGISHDPYAPAPGLGRVRHVYVLNQYRGRGAGRSLIGRLIAHARGRFEMLRLSTSGRPPASRLYESLGFVRCDGEKQTHRLPLSSVSGAG